MPQRNSGVRFVQGCPASFVIAKSAEAQKAGTTQHRAKHLLQSARRLRRPPSGSGSTCSRHSDNGCDLLDKDLELARTR